MDQTTEGISRIQYIHQLIIFGKVVEQLDISAIVYTKRFLIIAADEGKAIQILYTIDDKKRYSAKPTQIITLGQRRMKADSEIDIEAIARDGDTFYIVGSHALTRTRVKPKKPLVENRENFREVVREPERNYLAQLQLDLQTGELKGKIRHKSLYRILRRNAILRRFTRIPSKENGVDIEGLAIRNEALYIGFRAPVLRHNYVPVLRTSFKHLRHYDLLYVNLNGHGIRSMAPVSDGFLLLTGPVGDAIDTHRLYHWDGEDTMKGQSPDKGILKYIGDIPTPNAKGRAEGLALVSEEDTNYEILIVYDGLEAGAITLFSVQKVT